MGADDEQVRVVLRLQGADALLIPLDPGVVGGHHALECAGGQGHRRVALDGAAVVEGVPAVQDPPLAGVHGHGGVAERVSGERDEHEPVGDAGQGGDTVEPRQVSVPRACPTTLRGSAGSCGRL